MARRRKLPCRICLNNINKNTSVHFGSFLAELGENSLPVTILDALEKVMSVPLVINDVYPNQICQMCLGTLKASYELKMQFEESQSILQKYYKNIVDPSSFDKKQHAEQEEEVNFHGFLKNLGKSISAKFVTKHEGGSENDYKLEEPKILENKGNNIKNRYIIVDETDDGDSHETLLPKRNSDMGQDHIQSNENIKIIHLEDNEIPAAAIQEIQKPNTLSTEHKKNSEYVDVNENYDEALTIHNLKGSCIPEERTHFDQMDTISENSENMGCPKLEGSVDTEDKPYHGTSNIHYLCGNCQQLFSSENGYLEHLDSCENQQGDSFEGEGIKLDNPENSEEPGYSQKETPVDMNDDLILSALNMQFQCFNCKKFYKSQSGFARHLETCETQDDVENEALDDNFGNPRQPVHLKYTERENHIDMDDELIKSAMNMQFQCLHCKKLYLSEKRYIRHLETCEKKSCTTYSGVHIADASSEKPYILRNIQKEGTVDMEDELIKSALNMQYQCSYCRKIYASQVRYTKHQEICEKKHSDTLKNTKQKINKLWQCDLCERRFNQLKFLNHHVKAMHSSLGYTCKLCKITFRKRNSYCYHKLTKHSEQKYVCQYCGKKFFTNSSLKAHIHNHTDRTTAQCICPVCGKTFHYKGGLFYHMKKHTQERKYCCEFCDRKFYTLTAKKRHHRTHTGVRPYDCEVCGKKFFSSGELHKHEFIHKQERPYHCEFCGKGFTSSFNMKVHWFSHPGDFGCDVCSKNFVSVEVLKFHYRTKHKNFLKGETDSS
ncbi:hypothetical protein JTB14_018846 [Gonioctena quinquepunctata]|nr:hypothetical protein JTB14_018846 [Gonioctena quinquepunctata]